MKKIFLLLSVFVAFFSFKAVSQINQGAFLLGGSSYFNYHLPNGGGSNSNLNFSPSQGLFIVENMAIGAAVSFNQAGSTSTFAISPYLRAYYNKFFYGELQVGYGLSASGSNVISSGLVSEFNMGYSIFLSNQVALEPALYYNFYMDNSKYGGSNLGLKLGFQIFFNRK